MNNNELLYNKEHMEKISTNYQKCYENTDEIITKINSIKTSLETNYTGQASDMTSNLCAKINEHLELLKECFNQVSNYVTYSKDSMIKLDQSISDSLGGEK